jgi:hypothetical protein
VFEEISSVWTQELTPRIGKNSVIASIFLVLAVLLGKPDAKCPGGPFISAGQAARDKNSPLAA